MEERKVGAKKGGERVAGRTNEGGGGAEDGGEFTEEGGKRVESKEAGGRRG